MTCGDLGATTVPGAAAVRPLKWCRRRPGDKTRCAGGASGAQHLRGGPADPRRAIAGPPWRPDRRAWSVPGQLAMGDSMRPGRVDAQPGDLVLLVVGEVAFEEVPLRLVLVGALPRQDVRAGPVQEPAIVGDHHRAPGELLERVLQ